MAMETWIENWLLKKFEKFDQSSVVSICVVKVWVLDFHVEVEVYAHAGFSIVRGAKVVMYNNRKHAQCINFHFHMKI